MKKLFIVAILTLQLSQSQSQCINWQDLIFGNVPEELYRGRLKFAGMHYGNPYTMMDRRKFPNANEGYKSIRNAIQNSDDLKKMYSNIYKVATDPMPTEGWLGTGPGLADNVSPLSVYAKYCAFVFVIGLDDNFDPLDGTPANPANYYKRNAFRDNAKTALSNMGVMIPEAPWSGTDKPIALLKHRSRELMYYCEAYDWLKGAAEDSALKSANRNPFPPYDEDRNDGCSPRNKLRMLARNFYVAANGHFFAPIESVTGWKKNHGMMSAAAIGMAGIVLNDAGVEKSFWSSLFDWVTYSPNYSPQNWYELGSEYRENLLEGWHIWPFTNVPQTNDDGTAGYAEGPAYFNYAFSCLIPFLRADDNICQVFGNYHPFYDRAPFNLMFKWAEEINSGELMPSYDNSGSAASILGLLGSPNYSYGSQYHLDEGLAPDYIAIMAIPHKNIEHGVKQLFTSGNNIIRVNDDSTEHFFHMLTEQGIAIDKEASSYDGTHEDDDFGSFSLFVEKGSVQLAVDPPYFGWSQVYKTNSFGNHNLIKFQNNGSLATNFVQTSASTTQNGFQIRYGNYDNNLNYQGAIKRDVRYYQIGSSGRIYYMLHDYIEAQSGTTFTWRLGGNGYQHDTINTYSYDSINRVSLWKNPCPNWQLIHHYAFFDGVSHSPSKNTTTIEARGITSPQNKLTQLQLSQDKEHTLIQSFLMPFPCTSSTEQPPTFERTEATDYVKTKITFTQLIDTTFKSYSKKANNNYKDTISDFHLAVCSRNLRSCSKR